MVKLFYLITLVVLFQSTTAEAQKFSLTVSYTNSAKGRDSHSTTELINIADKKASYSVKYSGRRGPNQKDEVKKCTFTAVQLTSITELMKEKHLDVTDSLIDNSPAGETYATTEYITITESKNKAVVKIKVRGTTKALAGKLLYKNALYLTNFIRDMFDECANK